MASESFGIVLSIVPNSQSSCSASPLVEARGLGSGLRQWIASYNSVQSSSMANIQFQLRLRGRAASMIRKEAIFRVFFAASQN